MILKHVGRSVVIFGSIPKSNFWRIFDVFLDLVIFANFNAISVDFYSVKEEGFTPYGQSRDFYLGRVIYSQLPGLAFAGGECVPR